MIGSKKVFGLKDTRWLAGLEARRGNSTHLQRGIYSSAIACGMISSTEVIMICLVINLCGLAGRLRCLGGKIGSRSDGGEDQSSTGGQDDFVIFSWDNGARQN